jgi:hypothetical protein
MLHKATNSTISKQRKSGSRLRLLEMLVKHVKCGRLERVPIVWMLRAAPVAVSSRMMDRYKRGSQALG